MADADWAKYKQLRGRTLPETLEFQGFCYRQVRLFKRDFYAVTGLFETADPAAEHRQVLVKRYHTEPLGILPLGWLGRRLHRRETGFLKAVDGIPGVPRLLGMWDRTGFVREYVPGVHLREYRREKRPGREFYRLLWDQLAAVHARGIAHNDLSKAENILVRDGETPVIIDFQIALRFGWWFPGRARVRRFMQSVDRYHLGKHHRRDRPEDFTADELARVSRKSFVLKLHATLLRTPYRAVRHFVLRRFMTVRGSASV